MSDPSLPPIPISAEAAEAMSAPYPRGQQQNQSPRWVRAAGTATATAANGGSFSSTGSPPLLLLAHGGQLASATATASTTAGTTNQQIPVTSTTPTRNSSERPRETPLLSRALSVLRPTVVPVPQAWSPPAELSAKNTARVLESCGAGNRSTMELAGFGAVRVVVPELDAVKTCPVSPIMTVEQLRMQLLRALALEPADQNATAPQSTTPPVAAPPSPSGNSPSSNPNGSPKTAPSAAAASVLRHRLLLPVCLRGAKPCGLWLDPGRTVGTYGICLVRENKTLPVLMLVGYDPSKGGVSADIVAKHRHLLDPRVLSAPEEAKVAQWMAALSSWDGFVAAHPKKLLKMAKVGIPMCLRGDVWVRLSGARDLALKSPSVYRSLVDVVSDPNDDPNLEKCIRIDLARSMPKHPFFMCANEFGQRALSNVLHAFARYDRHIQYCQGLNFLAATLLCYMPEESVFWTVVQLMRKYGMRGFFIDGVPLYVFVLKTFEDVVTRTLPDLASHLLSEFVPISAIASPWFPTVFAATDLPRVVVDRIWDVFLTEGLPVIYSIGLAILKLQKERILKSRCEGIMKCAHCDWDESISAVLIETAVRYHTSIGQDIPRPPETCFEPVTSTASHRPNLPSSQPSSPPQATQGSPKQTPEVRVRSPPIVIEAPKDAAAEAK